MVMSLLLALAMVIGLLVLARKHYPVLSTVNLKMLKLRVMLALKLAQGTMMVTTTKTLTMGNNVVVMDLRLRQKGEEERRVSAGGNPSLLLHLYLGGCVTRSGRRSPLMRLGGLCSVCVTILRGCRTRDGRMRSGSLILKSCRRLRRGCWRGLLHGESSSVRGPGRVLRVRVKWSWSCSCDE